MANRTDKEAGDIHGTNPQNLVEKIVRLKVYDTIYWKESCFALTAESLIEKAVDLKAVGGTHGGSRAPCHFLCLITKMLQIQPDKEIIIEYIKNDDFKYVRLLGAFYMRLVGRPLEVYQYLEPLYNDFRKIRLQQPDGTFVLSHVDEIVDDMLRKDYMFDIALPRIPARHTMERMGQLEPRVSVLDDEFDEAVLEAEAGEAQAAATAAAKEADHAARAAEDEADAERRRREERAREKWREDGRERRGREDRERGSGRGDGDGDEEDRGRERRSHRNRSKERERDNELRDRGDKERERGGGDRDKERERERGGDRDRSDRDRDDRSGRERDRERRERDRSCERRRARSGERGDRDKERDRGHKSERDRETKETKPAVVEYKGSGGGKGVDTSNPEIAAANEMRAKLGLKPLK